MWPFNKKEVEIKPKVDFYPINTFCQNKILSNLSFNIFNAVENNKCVSLYSNVIFSLLNDNKQIDVVLYCDVIYYCKLQSKLEFYLVKHNYTHFNGQLESSSCTIDVDSQESACILNANYNKLLSALDEISTEMQKQYDKFNEKQKNDQICYDALLKKIKVS